MKKYRILCIETGEYLYRRENIDPSCVFSSEEVIDLREDDERYVIFEGTEEDIKYAFSISSRVVVNGKVISLMKEKEVFEFVELPCYEKI